MPNLIFWVVAAAAALFVTLSATMNALFLSSLGRTALETAILAALSIASDITKAALPVVIMRAVGIRAWAHVAGASLLLLFVTLLSLSSGTGFATLTRSGAIAARQSKADVRSALVSELGDAQMRLSRVTGARALGVIEADIAAAMIDRRWSVAKSCTEINSSSARQFCADLFKLRSERAAALEHDHLIATRNAAQAKLAALNSDGSGSESDPQAAAIAALLGIDPSMPRRVLTTFMAVVIELGSVILVLLLSGPALLRWREPGTEPDTRAVTAELPPSSDVSRWHKRRGAQALAQSGGTS